MILSFVAGVAVGVLCSIGTLGLVAALMVAGMKDVARATLGGD